MKIINSLLNFFDKDSVIAVGLNFHRIIYHKNELGESKLAYVYFWKFKILLLFCRLIGEFVSAGELSARQFNKGKIKFFLTFDDVSESIFPKTTDYLFNQAIPFMLFPCSAWTEQGYGLRDKIYHIMGSRSLSLEFVKKAHEIFSLQAEDLSINNIYGWSKSPRVDQRKLNDFLSSDMKIVIDKRTRYLTWNNLSCLILNNPLLAVGNHSNEHFDFRTMSSESINNDLFLAHKKIKEKTGIDCDMLSIPFGKYNDDISKIVNSFSLAHNYKLIFWVKVSSVLLIRNKPNSIGNLFRIHMSNRLWKNLLLIIYSLYNQKKYE